MLHGEGTTFPNPEWIASLSPRAEVFGPSEFWILIRIAYLEAHWT